MSDNVPGHAAPMQWEVVENPNDQPGMTADEIQAFLDRPISPMERLTTTRERKTSAEA